MAKFAPRNQGHLILFEKGALAIPSAWREILKSFLCQTAA